MSYGPPGRRIASSRGAVGSWYDFEYQETFNLNDQTQFHSKPTDFSAFLEDEWTLDGGSIYGGGIRIRRFSEGNRWLFEPRLAASWPVGQNKRVKLGGGLYHQYLQLVSTEGFSAGDFYLPIDASSQPPQSIQGVVGFDWRLTKTHDVTIEAYYTELADLLTLNNKQPADRVFSGASDAFTSGGRGFATGLELFLQRRIGALTGWVGYGLGWTRREFDEVNGGRQYPPKYDRRHDLNLVGNYRRGRWSYGASFTYATGQAFTPATARYELRDPATGAPERGGRLLPGEKNSARLLAYHRLDASVTRDFKIFGRPRRGIHPGVQPLQPPQRMVRAVRSHWQGYRTAGGENAPSDSEPRAPIRILGGSAVRTKIAEIAALACLLGAALAACSTDRAPGELFGPSEEGLLVVEAILIVDATLPPIRLTRTVRPDRVPDAALGEAGASVVVRTAGRQIPYFEVPDTLGHYRPTMAQVVLPDAVYELEVRTQNDEVLTATTRTPPSFSVDRWLLLDETDLSIRTSSSPSRTRGEVCTIRIYSSTPTACSRLAFSGRCAGVPDWNIEPRSRLGLRDRSDLFEDDDFEELERQNSSPALESADGFARLPWLAIFYEGRHLIRVHALDTNWYDLIRTDAELSGGGPGFGGNAGDSFDRRYSTSAGGSDCSGRRPRTRSESTILPRP